MLNRDLECQSAIGNTDQQSEENETKEPITTFTSTQKDTAKDDARVLGFWGFLNKYSPHYTLYELFDLFDSPLPSELSNAPLEELLPIFKSVFLHKGVKRERLNHSTVQDAISLIKNAKNIVVLTGAGVSVSCGIPDFRSENGIYSRLQEFELSDPQEMFDLEYFKFRPETFYSFANEIYPSNFKPSPSHKFIKVLEEKGKLLRNYTQNIDTLENVAGIKRVVQCHGSFATAKCVQCKYQVPGTSIEPEIFAKKVPYCPKCPDESGVMKPDIVFFGENLPSVFHDSWAEDRKVVDLLIVMGSSLKVAPVADVKDRIPIGVPQILINMESLPHMERFDIHLLGYCDTITTHLLEELDWIPKSHPTKSMKTLPGLISPPSPKKIKDDGSVKAKYQQGRLPWHWLFDGAKVHDVRSDCESEDESDMSNPEGDYSESDESEVLKLQDVLDNDSTAEIV
ncbi:DHS-like NAD/FAD-binding domain-containing protein [Globomyces pollinis-pini]|nr:DHS-like NAD/FAD-binding domain-containing protein [Globomyces pollinis-pini]